MNKNSCQPTRKFSLFKIGLVLPFVLFGFIQFAYAQDKSPNRSIDTTLKVTQKKSTITSENSSGGTASAEHPFTVMKKAGEEQVTNENGYFSKRIANVSKVDVFLNEVNRDCPQYSSGSYRETAIDCLNRTIFHKVPADQYPECPLLSTAMKKNKCNPDLVYNFEFDAENFNPLKYHFKYFSPNTSYYRVDGTEYIIEIAPSKN
jgi:hypothetical protein